MGSLPNLSELSKEKLDSPIHKPAPSTGGVANTARLQCQAPLLTHMHRKARSSGHHHHHAAQLWDNDAMLEVIVSRN